MGIILRRPSGSKAIKSQTAVLNEEPKAKKKPLAKDKPLNKERMEDLIIQFKEIKDSKKLLDERENALKEELMPYLIAAQEEENTTSVINAVTRSGETLVLGRVAVPKVSVDNDKAVAMLKKKKRSDGIISREIYDPVILQQLVQDKVISKAEFNSICTISPTQYRVQFIKDYKEEGNELCH